MNDTWQRIEAMSGTDKAPLALTVAELEALANFFVSGIADYAGGIGRLGVCNEAATIVARLDYLKSMIARAKVIIATVIDAKQGVS